MASVSHTLESLCKIDFADALLQSRSVVAHRPASLEDPGAIGIACVSFQARVQTHKPAHQLYHGIGYRVSGASTTRLDRPDSFRGGTGRTGMTAIVPAAEESSWLSAGPHEMVHIYIASQRVGELAAEIYGVDGARVQLQDAAFHVDEQIGRFAMAVRARLHDPEPVCATELNALADLVGAHLLRRYSNLAAKRCPEAAGRLSAADLRTLRDYITANLDSPLRLSKLARLVGMDQYRFARAFRATTGESPHRHVANLRVAHARDLLAGTDLPISRIATAAGFSSQSHMTHAFHARLSISPGRFRLEAGGHRANAHGRRPIVLQD